MNLVRRVTTPLATCLLVSYAALICGGVWLPSERDSQATGSHRSASPSESFPCAGKGCGCRSASHCHENCCCRRGRPRTDSKSPATAASVRDAAGAHPTSGNPSDANRPTALLSPIASSQNSPAEPVLAWEAAACRGMTTQLTLFCMSTVVCPAIATDDVHAVEYVTFYDSPSLANPSYPPSIPPA